MAGGVELKVSGADAVARALSDLAREVEDLPGAFSEIADTGKKAAVGFAPRRTGALARNIRGTFGKGQAEVTATIRYARPINSGVPSRNIRATRFMQKAQEVLQQRASVAIEDDINKKINSKGLT